jgi:hypothetical protein
MKFKVFVVEELAISYSKVIDCIRSERIDCLFIDLPTSVEATIQSISFGAPWRQELIALKENGLLRAPHDSQRIKAIEPLLFYLQDAGISAFCYRDPFDEDLLHKLSGDMFALTASSRIFGIKTSRWLSLIDDLIMIDIEINVRDGIYVIEKAGEKNAILGGEGLAEFLRNRGYEVEMTIIDQSIKPLDLLKKYVAQAQKERKEVPSDVVEYLIRSHLDFVETIIQSNSYEEAYFSWKNKIKGIAQYEEAIKCFNKSIELDARYFKPRFHKVEPLKSLDRDNVRKSPLKS